VRRQFVILERQYGSQAGAKICIDKIL